MSANDQAKSVGLLSVQVGQRLANRRKQLGLTQEKASEMSGLSQQFFACVENGSKNIRAESIVRICSALDISADYLLTGHVNDVDRNHLVKMMEPLSECQLKCLEEIIKNFLVACNCAESLF